MRRRQPGNGIQQCRVDPTEDRGIRADAQGKRQNGDHRISRRFGDHPQAVPHVLPQGSHPVPLKSVRAWSGRTRDL